MQSKGDMSKVAYGTRVITVELSALEFYAEPKTGRLIKPHFNHALTATQVWIQEGVHCKI